MQYRALISYERVHDGGWIEALGGVDDACAVRPGPEVAYYKTCKKGLILFTTVRERLRATYQNSGTGEGRCLDGMWVSKS